MVPRQRVAKRRARTNEPAFERVLLARCGADAEDSAVAADPGKPVDDVEVDQDRWCGEAEIHHRHEALPPCDEPRVRAVARQKRQRLVEIAGPMHLECGGLHGPSSMIASTMP